MSLGLAQYFTSDINKLTDDWNFAVSKNISTSTVSGEASLMLDSSKNIIGTGVNISGGVEIPGIKSSIQGIKTSKRYIKIPKLPDYRIEEIKHNRR